MESFQLNKWQTFPSKPGLSSFIPRHFHHLRASKGPTKLDVCHIYVNVHNAQRKCDWKSFKLYVSYHEQLVSLWDHFRQAVTGSLQDNKDEEPHKSAVNYHTICAPTSEFSTPTIVSLTLSTAAVASLIVIVFLLITYKVCTGHGRMNDGGRHRRANFMNDGNVVAMKNPNLERLL